MKLIVGLGNPGGEYKNTRHNVGQIFIDKLAKAMNAAVWKKNEKVDAYICLRKPLAILAKPTTFMNESGKTIKKIFKYFKFKSISETVVVHDDLDLRLGAYKIQKGHGPQLHNGVNSIEEEFGSEWFTRVRIGVDNRDPEGRLPGEKYVLQKFSDDELSIVNSTCDRAIPELLDLLVKERI